MNKYEFEENVEQVIINYKRELGGINVDDSDDFDHKKDELNNALINDIDKELEKQIGLKPLSVSAQHELMHVVKELVDKHNVKWPIELKN
jgi:hypothetical protein